MGMMDFVKSAGSKLFDWGKGDEEQSAKLAGHIEALGLKVENLEVICDDDCVTLKGTVPTQTDQEKIVLLVGNSEGVAKVDDQLKVARKEAESTFHKVVAGETLSGIAKVYYGDPKKYPTIFEANKPMLTHPDKIFPGQILRVPSLS